jgi:hypothetical protein
MNEIIFPIGCTAAALIGAATNGHVEVMHFLILHVASLGQYIQVACDAACKMGKMNVIKYAVKSWMCGCSPTGLDDLAEIGDTKILEYLLKNRILPSQSYLYLASDLSDEDTISLESDDINYQKVFTNGQSYVSIPMKAGIIEFDDIKDMECTNDFSDLDEDMDEEDLSDFSDSDGLDGDCSDHSSDANGEDCGSSKNGLSDGESSEDYDIDDEEDSFDRHIQKKKETILTCLFDDTDQNDTVGSKNVATLRNPKVSNLPEETLRSLLKRPDDDEISVEEKERVSLRQEGLVEGPRSTGANSLGMLDVDTFCLRSIVGDAKSHETFRQWSPATWRESIDSTMDRVVSNPDRMVMLPFMFKNLSGRVSCVGIEKACDRGCLDILQWIYSSHVTQSSSPDHHLFSTRAMIAACNGGHRDVAVWLRNVVRLPKPTPEIAMTAAAKGSVSFLHWLFVTCGIELHPEACNLATSSGNCPAVIWLHEFSRGRCEYSINAVDMAAINGHISVIVFLGSIGIKSSAIAADGALMNGHLEVYKHLTKLGAFPSHYATHCGSLPWPTFDASVEAGYTHTTRSVENDTDQSDAKEGSDPDDRDDEIPDGDGLMIR